MATSNNLTWEYPIKILNWFLIWKWGCVLLWPEVIFFLVNPASPRTISIDKKKISSGTQGSTTLTIKYISHFLSYRFDASMPRASGGRKLKIQTYFFIIVVLARDILLCLGKAPENNRAFYEFMIYRNVQEHGDSRQKKIIMKTTNNVNENQRNVYLSCRWKLDALQYFN